MALTKAAPPVLLCARSSSIRSQEPFRRSTQQLRSHLQLLCARLACRALEHVAPGFDTAAVLSCCALAETVPGCMARETAGRARKATAPEFCSSARRRLTQLRQLAALIGSAGWASLTRPGSSARLASSEVGRGAAACSLTLVQFELAVQI